MKHSMQEFGHRTTKFIGSLKTMNPMHKKKSAPVKVKDIMRKKVEVVSPDTFLHKVATQMEENNCGGIIVAKDDKPVGIITDRDLALRCVAKSHAPAKTTAEQVMTRKILCCRDSDDIEEVTANMARNKISRMPVLDKDKRLVGIVSLCDLASNFTENGIGRDSLGREEAIPKHTPYTLKSNRR